MQTQPHVRVNTQAHMSYRPPWPSACTVIFFSNCDIDSLMSSSLQRLALFFRHCVVHGCSWLVLNLCESLKMIYFLLYYGVTGGRKASESRFCHSCMLSSVTVNSTSLINPSHRKPKGDAIWKSHRNRSRR